MAFVNSSSGTPGILDDLFGNKNKHISLLPFDLCMRFSKMSPCRKILLLLNILLGKCFLKLIRSCLNILNN